MSMSSLGRRVRLLAAAITLAVGCRGSSSNDAPATTTAAALPPTAPLAAPATSTVRAARSARSSHPHALDNGAFQQLVSELSEPDKNFFSDNFISNETSYLQPAQQLQQRRRGGVYLGVGPEQNFSYIALTRPDMAYIIDIRRDNLVLHLLYKAAFDLARSRFHFLTLLTGRPRDHSSSLPPHASIDQVLTRAERLPPSEASYATAHQALRERVQAYGFVMTGGDGRAFERVHRAFFKGGLELRFSLKEHSLRRYPSLRSLLASKSPAGARLGFLASEGSFLFLQQLQRDNRIVPLVGDFAGDGALPALAEHLRQHNQKVRSFYVSNVEQYLMQNGLWWKWQRNVAALPADGDSIFIRSYLDQGKHHPRQLKGHRTTTTLHLMQAFKRRHKPYPSMWALATDGYLVQSSSPGAATP